LKSAETVSREHKRGNKIPVTEGKTSSTRRQQVKNRQKL